MKKVAFRIARVHWKMGQALLPEHFFAQEESLRGEASLRFGLSPVPAYGLGTLVFDPIELERNGILDIEEMTLVLPSGTLIDIPGNTRRARIDLRKTGAASPDVYLHLQGKPSEEVVTRGAERAADEEGIERAVQAIELSINPTSPSALQSFHLARVRSDAEGKRWSLSPAYLPPLLCVGRSRPFFDDQLRRMRLIGDTFVRTLRDEVDQNYLAGESQAAAKQTLRGVYGFLELLDDLLPGSQIAHHPYQVFCALRALRNDICVFRGVDPTELRARYEHDALFDCLEPLLRDLEERAKVGPQAVSYEAFARRESNLVCEVHKAKRARDVFLLIKKPQVSTQLSLEGIKLASPSRLYTIHQRALRGVPFERCANVPFFHGFPANVEFYSILPGEEWDHAVREGSLVMQQAPALAGCELFLYWRNG